MKRLIVGFLIISLCVCLSVSVVYAASPEDVDYTYMPFTTIPYPSELSESHVDYTNLTLFYYDYTTYTYYAIFTLEEVDLLSTIKLHSSDDLGGYFTSSHIYKSDTDTTVYSHVTLSYAMDENGVSSGWTSSDISEEYVYITCVTEKKDILYYGGEVIYDYVVEESPSTDTTDEETTKKWYDYILDGIKTLLSPMTDFFTNNFLMTEKFVQIYNLFVDIKNTIAEKTGNDNILQPVIDFFSKITNTTIALLEPFWDFPGVRDMLMVTVIVLLFGGIFKFCFGG